MSINALLVESNAKCIISLLSAYPQQQACMDSLFSSFELLGLASIFVSINNAVRSFGQTYSITNGCVRMMTCVDKNRESELKCTSVRNCFWEGIKKCWLVVAQIGKTNGKNWHTHTCLVKFAANKMFGWLTLGDVIKGKLIPLPTSQQVFALPSLLSFPFLCNLGSTTH